MYILFGLTLSLFFFQPMKQSWPFSRWVTMKSTRPIPRLCGETQESDVCEGIRMCFYLEEAWNILKSSMSTCIYTVQDQLDQKCCFNFTQVSTSQFKKNSADFILHRHDLWFYKLDKFNRGEYFFVYCISQKCLHWQIC